MNQSAHKEKQLVREVFPSRNAEIYKAHYIEGLNPELVIGIERELQLTQETVGFVSLRHPVCIYLQEQAKKMAAKGAIVTRVLVTSDSKKQAGCYPDGTIIVSAGFLNMFPYEELKAVVLAHEISHFEEKHAKRRGAVTDNSDFSYFADSGITRLIEAEADLTALFKLDQVKQNPILYKFFIEYVQRMLGSGQNVDITHGDFDSRQLQTLGEYRVFDFETNDEPVLTKANSSWTLKEKNSDLEQLEDKSVSHEAFFEYLKQASPLVRGRLLELLIHKIYVRLARTKQVKKWKHEDYEIKLTKLRSELSFFSARFASFLSFIDIKYAHSVKDCEESYMWLASVGSSFFNHESLAELFVEADFVPFLKPVSDFIKKYSVLQLESLTSNYDFSIDVPTFYSRDCLNDLVLFFYRMENTQQVRDSFADGRLVQYLDFLFAKIQHWKKLQQNDHQYSDFYFFHDVINILADVSFVAAVPKTIIKKVLLSLHSYAVDMDVDIHKLKLDQIGSRIFCGDAHRYFSEKEKFETKKQMKEFVSQLREDFCKCEESFVELIKSPEILALEKLFQEDPKYCIKQIKNLYIHNRISVTLQKKILSILTQSQFNFLQKSETDILNKLVFCFSSKSNIETYGARTPEEEQLYHTLAAIFNFLDLAFLSHYSLPLQQRIQVVGQLITSKFFQDVYKTVPIQYKNGIIRYCFSFCIGGKSFSNDDFLVVHYKIDSSIIDDVIVQDALQQFCSLPLSSELLSEMLRPPEQCSIPELHAHVRTIDFFFYDWIFDFSQGIENNQQFIDTLTAKLAAWYVRFYDYISQIKWQSLGIQEMELLFEVIALVEEKVKSTTDTITLKFMLQSMLIKRQDISLEDKLLFLKKQVGDKQLTAQALFEFIELQITNFDSYSVVKERGREFLQNPSEKEIGDIGLISFVEQISQFLLKEMNPTEALELILKTGKDDLDLRKIVLLYQLKCDFIGNFEDDKATYLLFPWSVPTEIHLKSLYELPDTIKLLLLNRLFLSENGIFRNKEYHASFVDMLIEYIETSEERRQLFKVILESALETIDPVLLFYFISGMLMKLVLIPPQKKSLNIDTLDVLIDEKTILEECKPELLDEKKKLLLAFFDCVPYEIYKSAKNRGKELVSQENVIGTARKKCITALNEQMGFVGKERNNSLNKVRDVEVIQQLAFNSAPIGPTVLQLFLQILDTDLFTELLDMYDNVQTGSKFSAFYVLEQLAKQDERFSKILTQGLTDVTQRLGGGKVASVYEGRLYDEKVALKVANPNVEGFVNLISQEARKCLKRLVTADQKNAKMYRTLLLYLDLTVQWVLQELHHGNDQEADKIFEGTMQDKVLSSGYAVYVAKNYYMSEKVRIDELVDGVAIGRVLTASKDSVSQKQKEVVGESYVELLLETLQPIDAIGTRRVLVDPSVGNILFDLETKKVLPIDRQYHTFSAQDWWCISTVLTGSFSFRTIPLLIEYLLAQPENHAVDPNGRKIVELKNTFLLFTLLAQAKKSVSKLRRREKKENSGGNGLEGMELFRKISQLCLDADLLIPFHIQMFFAKTVAQANHVFRLLHSERRFEDMVIANTAT